MRRKWLSWSNLAQRQGFYFRQLPSVMKPNNLGDYVPWFQQGQDKIILGYSGHRRTFVDAHSVSVGITGAGCSSPGPQREVK